MKLALVCVPPSDANLKLGAQIGATDFVSRYSGIETAEKFAHEAARAQSFGLKLSVVEGFIPLQDIIRGGENRDAQIENVARLIREMGARGVQILCYNWMPNDDWTRTSFRVPARGGAVTNEFNLAQLPQREYSQPPISADALWENLETFLRAVLPVAEEAGVKLAMHPDDPPLRELSGSAQIMHAPEDFERLFEIAPSPNNGMCLCSGSFSSGGEDVAAMVPRFGKRIHYAHLRSVRGTVPHFVETFHDEGQTDLPRVVRALYDIGFDGIARPDHVPQLEGETGDATGYTMPGRLFAIGYLRGLMQAIESEK